MIKLVSGKTFATLMALGIFTASTWSVGSTPLFSMQHELQNTPVRKQDSRQISLKLRISNNSATDLTAISLQPINQPFMDQQGQPPSVKIDRLASGETRTLIWNVKVTGYTAYWRPDQEMVFIGSARSEGKDAISLSMTSRFGDLETAYMN